MARGARKSFDDQVAALEVQIDKVQGKLDGLLEAKEDLLRAKKETEVGRLYDFIESRGMSAEQFIEFAEGAL